MYKIILSLISFLLPSSALAYYYNGEASIDSMIFALTLTIIRIIPILIGVAVLVFIWGLIKYIKTNSDSEKKEAIGIITYGIIGLFVIVAIWGIVALLGDTLGIYTPFFGPNVPDEVVIPLKIEQI